MAFYPRRQNSAEITFRIAEVEMKKWKQFACSDASKIIRRIVPGYS
jgi:hypothetical protein